jgi:cholesterol oxidase
VSARYALQFTEEMKGWFSPGEEDFVRGAEQGRAVGSSLMFHLTITTDDVRRFIDDPRHVASTRGWVSSAVLGGRLPVVDGLFNLFVTEGPHARRMLYRLNFEDRDGHPLTLSGFKEIHGGGLNDVWPETSTLYTRILQGYVDEEAEKTAAVVGSGVLHILPRDFARQLTTFRVRGGSLPGRLRALAEFGRLFAGQLFVVFAWRRRPERPKA